MFKPRNIGSCGLFLLHGARRRHNPTANIDDQSIFLYGDKIEFTYAKISHMRIFKSVLIKCRSFRFWDVESDDGAPMIDMSQSSLVWEKKLSHYMRVGRFNNFYYRKSIKHWL
jgi:hypothetical protein